MRGGVHAQQFVRHTGIAAPFLRSDVEGEVIAPLGRGLQDLHGVHLDPGGVVIVPHAHDGSWTGQHAFHGLRFELDGSEKSDFVLNREPYRDASILLAGRNFGLGSLQGFAVIRLMQCGIRVVVARSFGPVFYDDCFDYGLLPVTLDEDLMERIVEAVTADPRVQMSVDLLTQSIERAGMEAVPFDMDPRRRLRLLTGRDGTLEERLEHADSAAARRERDRRERPWLYDRGRTPRE